MRSARWEWALVACAIAACQVDANSAVQVDANSAVQRSELSSDTCRPALLRRCEATNCGHRCADDATAPPGHLINFFDCTSSGATSCSATFTTCDPTTGLDDPPPAPIVFDCGDDHCRGPAPPVTCRPSGCVADCDADLQSRIPVGWRITAANCDASSESSCAESMTVCEVATGTIVPLSTALSCPACPPQPQVPCTNSCGHNCAADVAAKVPSGEQIVGSGCIGSSTDPQCTATADTCDANGDRHHYSSSYSDPCCGDPCCGDPCCGDMCCGDPCCGDPCCGDECCGDPCCGDPCCGDECCGDPCCGDPECCEFGGCGYGFSGQRVDAQRTAGPRRDAQRTAGPRREGPASSLRR